MKHALLLLALLSCNQSDEGPTAPVHPDVPLAGAAEVSLDLPVGTPMGGFSSRSTYLGGDSKPDNRDSAYSTGFVESAGLQTRPQAKVLWIENGDRALVFIKVDLIYSYDNLVVSVTKGLEAATGLDLTGQVFVTANHSHNSYGPFSDQYHFYLGGDRYNEEIFQRLTQPLVDVGLTAYNARQPAAIGTSWTKDWDPNNRVYRDRRHENDALKVWGEEGPAVNGKDPWLHLMRVDSLQGEPIALTFTYGIHGTMMGGDSPMLSTDAPGHVELVVQESFPKDTVVIHFQGGGGDASPAGSGHGYARMETLGLYAEEAIVQAWADTPTRATPISIETASRHIPELHDQIHVTRNGQVDWRYTPWKQATAPDLRIYDEQGALLSPIDEFNAPYGAAFCGSDTPLLPVGSIGSTVFPYETCMDVEMVTRVLEAIFDLPFDSIPLPLPSSKKAGTSAALIGPLLTRQPDGSVTEDDLLIGFFPGEATAMYTEQWRQRVQSELGLARPLMIAYAQDHEGYLLVTEDWLLGGYEPNINVWGPLQGEHIMEGVLTYSRQLLGNGQHDQTDPLGLFTPTAYPERPLPTVQPDVTPDAGSLLDSVPDFFYLPLSFSFEADMPLSIARVQGQAQLTWLGGDPMVDLPVVTLQREVDGLWEGVTTPSGRPITDALPDILLTHTPDPLYPVEAAQRHLWWANWQAVGHLLDRTQLPLGSYRLVVDGAHWVGEETTWPWTTEPYHLEGPVFEVTEALVSLALTETGVQAWIQAPETGYRLVDLQGDSTGSNPLHGDLIIQWGDNSGTESSAEIVASSPVENRTDIPLDLSSANWVRVTDAAGNTGQLDW